MKIKILLVTMILLITPMPAEDFSHVLNGSWMDESTYDFKVSNPVSSIDYDGKSFKRAEDILSIGIFSDGTGGMSYIAPYLIITDVQKQGSQYTIYISEPISEMVFNPETNKSELTTVKEVSMGELIITVVNHDKIIVDFTKSFRGTHSHTWYRVSDNTKEPISKAIVNDTKVRLRTEPNLESGTWAYLNTGDVVTVIDKSEEMQKIGDMEDYWYQIETVLFPDGWIYGAFLDEFVETEEYAVINWTDKAIEGVVRSTTGLYDTDIVKKEVESIEILEWTLKNVQKLDDLRHLSSLKYLTLNESDIGNLEPLTTLKELVNLSFKDCVIDDLSALSQMKGLRELNLFDCEQVDIASIANAKIQDLSIWDSNIINIEFLKNLPNLKSLDLKNCTIDDVNSLKSLNNLVTLTIENCNLDDISFVQDLTQLKTLRLPHNNIEDISFIQGLTQLDYIDVAHNKIEDISVFNILVNLENLSLDSNNIKDITPLKNITNWKKIDIEKNPIEIVVPIERYKTIQFRADDEIKKQMKKIEQEIEASLVAEKTIIQDNKEEENIEEQEKDFFINNPVILLVCMGVVVCIITLSIVVVVKRKKKCR